MKKIVLTSLCILIIGIGLTSKNNYPYDYCLPDTIEVKSPPLKPKKQKSNLIEALATSDYGLLDASDMDYIFQKCIFGSCVYG